MIDPADKIEAGPLGQEQAPTAMRAIWALWSVFIPVDWREPGETWGRGHHLGSSFMHPSPNPCPSRMLGWRGRDDGMKLLWRRVAAAPNAAHSVSRT